MHFQDLVKEAKQTQADGVELALYLDPYAETEETQFGYIPVQALNIFPRYIVLGYISSAGDVTLRNMV